MLYEVITSKIPLKGIYCDLPIGIHSGWLVKSKSFINLYTLFEYCRLVESAFILSLISDKFFIVYIKYGESKVPKPVICWLSLTSSSILQPVNNTIVNNANQE